MGDKKQNYITHVAYVVDASGSMNDLRHDVVQVVDNQTAFLADLSRAQDHEVRVSVYLFNNPDNIQCVIFDKDVLRLPSIKEFYEPDGMTALIDATLLAITDLQKTMVKYGDHAFLLFTFTDGKENRSINRASALSSLIAGLGPQWTVAGLVPDINAKLQSQAMGFPAGNLSIWNPNSATGVEEAGQEMQAALSGYLTMRSTGMSGTQTLFSTDAKAVNAATIKAAGLAPLQAGTYNLVPVTKPRDPQGVLNRDKHRVWEISQFVAKAAGVYRVGKAFYQLSKKERIQGNKLLAIVGKNDGKVFVGDGVRAMIGLPEGDKSVAPDFNPDYDIYVQSSSTNRHLVAGTKVLILE